MGFNFSLFGENEHRQFNYKPRYYDVEKEERRQFFGDHPEIEELADEDTIDGQNKDAREAMGKAKAEHKPGRYISGSFRDGHYQRTKKDTTKTQTVIGIITFILIFLVFVYISKFYGFLLK